MRRIVLLTPVVAALALIAAATGSAARGTVTLDCGTAGTFPATVTMTTNDHSVAWGVATISGGTHLIPTSFSFTATDLTAGGTVLFSATNVKGNGNGLHNQGPVLTCSTPTEFATAGELGIPANVAPPDDVIQIDMSATAVMAG
jgi:hypothetical protein